MEKFTNGAIVFYRSRNVTPALPQDVRDHAQALGIDPALVPDYAGDRATVSRAIAACAPRLAREGWLLRPHTTRQDKVVYGVIREEKERDRNYIKHTFEATVYWDAQKPDRIEQGVSLAADVSRCGHDIDAEYQSRRGRIVAADWTDAITAYLVRDCNASAMRDDGRVYWLPPQYLLKAHTLSTLLSTVGISLILCEIEAGNVQDVKDAATDSLESELARMQEEIAGFDGTQRPSNYARRLEEITALQMRARAYHAALGVSIEQTTTILDTLEERVSEMLHKRKRTTVKRAPKECAEALQPAYAF